MKRKQLWVCLVCKKRFTLHPGAFPRVRPKTCPWCEQGDTWKFKQLERRKTKRR